MIRSDPFTCSLASSPLTNAVFDYISYVVTLWLVEKGQTTGGWTFILGLVNLAVALVLFTALGTTMILVVAGANALAGVPLFPLAPLFGGIDADPGNYLWLYVTLFSTIVPTMAHLIVMSFGLIVLPFVAPVRLRLGRWVNGEDVASTFLGPLGLGMIWTLSIALPIAFLFALYLAASAVLPNLATDYLDWFKTVARWVGELPPAQP